VLVLQENLAIKKHDFLVASIGQIRSNFDHHYQGQEDE
jgi:hypothetical protein